MILFTPQPITTDAHVKDAHMTNVLFVNASPRQENSAAVQAAQIFLENVSGASITTLNLIDAIAEALD